MANPLAQLIETRLDQGDSIRGIATRGGDPDARSRLSSLRHADGLTDPPKTRTIRLLSQGLYLPELTVYLAAGEACGLDMVTGSAQKGAWLPQEAEYLKQDDIDYLRGVIRNLGELRRDAVAERG